MAGEYEEMVSDDKMNPRTALCVHWLFYPPSLHFIPKIWALCWLACPRTTSGKLWACQDQRIECWVSEREHDFLSDIWVLCCFFFTDFIDKMKWSCLTWISGSSLQTETADLSSVGYIRSMAGMDMIRTLLLSDLLNCSPHSIFIFIFNQNQNPEQFWHPQRTHNFPELCDGLCHSCCSWKVFWWYALGWNSQVHSC